MLFKSEILEIVAQCRAAHIDQNLDSDDILDRVIPEKAQGILNSATEFLQWIRDDDEYRFYYYDVQESGICAKPKEVAAMIIEVIVLEALAESSLKRLD